MQAAGIALMLYEYCMDAGHKLAQSDADVVWDLQATPGRTHVAATGLI